MLRMVASSARARYLILSPSDPQLFRLHMRNACTVSGVVFGRDDDTNRGYLSFMRARQNPRGRAEPVAMRTHRGGGPDGLRWVPEARRLRRVDHFVCEFLGCGTTVGDQDQKVCKTEPKREWCRREWHRWSREQSPVGTLVFPSHGRLMALSYQHGDRALAGV